MRSTRKKTIVNVPSYSLPTPIIFRAASVSSFNSLYSGRNRRTLLSPYPHAHAQKNACISLSQHIRQIYLSIFQRTQLRASLNCFKSKYIKRVSSSLSFSVKNEKPHFSYNPIASLCASTVRKRQPVLLLLTNNNFT